ncbi:bifunctional UDP-sugar hydrolase/5'-nucleotidase [Alistipes sp.]|uniref:bifunctional metallophosphatase/5'-nucleotidase n=1 Tax=Alistipes sp. TaxID=1872444 RepID=UPI0025B8EF6F|nr:bifunctional UDP-sugar hydrolase/5'-nucleotidase [Alistipes sp.]
MKRWICPVLLVVVACMASCAPRERTLVVLSTNDMHAKIQCFPRLAAAVAACRDTLPGVLLVDAGDRWTGNAYVDKCAVPGKPIIGLMNRLRYDAATLGNHEFDFGQAFLGRMIDSMDFEVVCANVVSDTCTFPHLAPGVIFERDGVKIGFVGAITNYEGPGHPAGNAANFEGLEFPDPQQEALRCAERMRPEVDVLVLLSHMGDDRDRELLEKTRLFDLVIGGHTHVVRDTIVNGTLLTQTGKDLRNVGVAKIRLRGRKVLSVDYDLVPLDAYEPDAAYQAEVDRYYADPELNRPVGTLGHAADKWGLANWMAAAIADEEDAEVGFYHIGGVRLDSLAAGGVGTARIYDLEPFDSHIAVMRMTPAQMRRMIVAKYNESTREGHRIDLISTTPYEILTDEDDNAFDVRFPALREGLAYRVAISDYVFRNYRELAYAEGGITDERVADALLDELEEDSPLAPDNRPRQRVIRMETKKR